MREAWVLSLTISVDAIFFLASLLTHGVYWAEDGREVREVLKVCCEGRLVLSLTVVVDSDVV